MANYAIVKNHVVFNTVVCEAGDIPKELPEGVSYVPYTEDNPAVIGLGYNGEIFEQPVPSSATADLILRLAEGQG